MRLNSTAYRAGNRLPATSAARTNPALETIMSTGSRNASAITNPTSRTANIQTVARSTLPFAALLSLRLSNHRVQNTGRVRYVKPIRAPASNPAANAPSSEAGLNVMNVSSDSRSIPING